MKDNLNLSIDQNADGIFTLDKSGKFIKINTGLIEITETSQEDLIKMNLWSFSSSEDGMKIIQKFQKARSGVSQRFESNIYTWNGKKIILEITLGAAGSNEVCGIARNITPLRETKFAREKSVIKFGDLIRQGFDIIFILESDGSFKWVSGNSVSVLGLEPEHFIQESIFDFIHPEDKETVKREFKNLIISSDQKTYVFRIKNGKGEWRWMEAKARDLRHVSNINGIVVNARDITEKYILQRALEKSEQKYRVFFQKSLDGILLTSPTGEIFAANPAACEMFQMNEEELCRMRRQEIIDLSDPKVGLEIEKRQKIENSVSEITMRRKDGSKFSAEVSTSAFEERNGEKRASIIIRDRSFQDIDTIKRAQLEAIKASEEKDSILESIGDGFFAVDNDWVVTYFNKKAEEFLECPKDEILGQNAWEIFPDAIETDFYRFYNKALQEKTIQHFEEYLERVDKWFDVSVYPSCNGLSVYFRDITERKKSSLKLIQLNEDLKIQKKELLRANSGLEQFSFIVSHNLRAPVANILGLANHIKDKQYPQELRHELQKELFDNIRSLDTVIKDLNKILELKENITAKKETIALEELVDSIKGSIYGLIQKEQVEINTDFAEVPTIHSVPSYLHSIFYNLITNSIKYRRPNISPVIYITAKISDGRVIFNFKDNGLGIDLKKRRNQIFGLYKRFHSHLEGKGIGLFMVKNQIEALGGRIEVQSELNKGTEFTVELQQNSTYK